MFWSVPRARVGGFIVHTMEEPHGSGFAAVMEHGRACRFFVCDEKLGLPSIQWRRRRRVPALPLPSRRHCPAIAGAQSGRIRPASEGVPDGRSIS